MRALTGNQFTAEGTAMRTLSLIALLAGAVAAASLSGEQILDKMDGNRDHRTVTADARMEIHIGDEVRSKNMRIKGMTDGNRSIVEFTNPEDEGTKYLMLEDNLWIYFPQEQEVVRISGHMLKDGMMGSDVSYEDALEADQLRNKYDVSVVGEQTYNERPCYVLELNATTRDAPYYKRKMWVDKETFVAWKEEMFAKSGKLLKEATVLAADTIGGRHFPVKTKMEDKLRRNSHTIFEMTNVELDKPLDEDMFSMRYLRR
ncbi:MAG: outer membrane lipoprotein-sorting protein [Chitinivibrionales bacterium]|nr:outer membrane lipoprotein-sorting protein [Chitinivibrionales bacterium]